MQDLTHTTERPAHTYTVTRSDCAKRVIIGCFQSYSVSIYGKIKTSFWTLCACLRSFGARVRCSIILQRRSRVARAVMDGGQVVWAPHPEEGYQRGLIVDVCTDTLTVEPLQGGKVCVCACACLCTCVCVCWVFWAAGIAKTVCFLLAGNTRFVTKHTCIHTHTHTHTYMYIPCLWWIEILMTALAFLDLATIDMHGFPFCHSSCSI